MVTDKGNNKNSDNHDYHYHHYIKDIVNVLQALSLIPKLNTIRSGQLGHKKIVNSIRYLINSLEGEFLH